MRIAEILALVTLATFAPPSLASTLDRTQTGPLPGDPAPPIRASAWIRGEPVEQYESGRVYVVDLWATWCAPCLTTMPLLARFQERFRDRVTIVAMNVWEMNPDRVPGLVESRADSMPRFVALDSIPPGKEANEGLTSLAFVGVTETISIPRTFLIDGVGRVAWIGTPHDLEEPLAAVLAGTWDLETHAREYALEMERELRYRSLFAPVEAAVTAKQWTVALDACEAVLAADSSFRRLIPNEGFVHVAGSIVRQQAPTKAELLLARRAVKRALALGASPAWRIHLLGARVARAAGDPREAERRLTEARRQAPADSKHLVPPSIQALSMEN